MKRMGWMIVDLIFYGICGAFFRIGFYHFMEKMGQAYENSWNPQTIIILLILGIPGSIYLVCKELL